MAEQRNPENVDREATSGDNSPRGNFGVVVRRDRDEAIDENLRRQNDAKKRKD